MNNIVCNNCNKIGHTFNNCTAPVTSYGILLLKIIDNKSYILMINRKDSLCYIEFIRGKYNIKNPNYIQILVDKFTISEKEKIRTKSFDELWKDLWLIDSLENIKHKSDYEKSKSKFNNIKKGMIVDEYFYNIETFLKNTICSLSTLSLSAITLSRIE